MNNLFDYNSPRSRQARLHVFLSGYVRYLAIALACLVAAVGIWFIVLREPLGWFLSGCAIALLTPFIWDERYLKVLPAAPGGRVDDCLESGMLALLKPDLNRASLVEALGQVRSVQFMMVRAGISPQFLNEQLSTESVESAWRRALEDQPAGIIRGSDLFACLLRADPTVEAILPHLQLDQGDVETVAKWYDHLDKLIAHHSVSRSTGGIARDWSFGYSPLLARFGVNISENTARAGGTLTVDIEAHQNALEFLYDTFGTSGKQNVALVGPTGSGKSTIVEAFAEQIYRADSAVPKSLQYRQVVGLSASALISAASGRGELEQLVNDVLLEAYRAKNIVVCLEDAELFFEEGVGSVDLANLLKPVLDGGVLRIILTMDDQRFLKIAQRNPAISQTMNRFSVEPASQDETMRVLQDQLILTEYSRHVTYMYQALRESYRLSERYMHDMAQPGKALQILVAASQRADNGLVTAASVQQAVEQNYGVKIGANVKDDEKDKLLNLEALIHERMINQTRAVSVVSDALRRARAGVRNEQRPIGTFLFLGPTGVGKTELAKALAAVYFNDENKLLRLDMNEFVSSDDVKRLIADGVDDPHSLSAQVMKQPFSVILLDEIEKAHDSVLATLLQVLDEGILRDIKGREVSFRDTLIIATSNAGAEQIRHHIEAGEELEQFEQELENELVNSKQFRPEFLNRFDEIVLFRPLSQLELAKVVELIIAGVNKTLEPQKVSVAIDTELTAWLVVKGNDPRLGARPMRRMVQRVVENIMARRMLSGDVKPGETVVLTLADVPEELR